MTNKWILIDRSLAVVSSVCVPCLVFGVVFNRTDFFATITFSCVFFLEQRFIKRRTVDWGKGSFKSFKRL